MIKVSFVLEEFNGSVMPRFTFDDENATTLEKRVLEAQKDTFKGPLALPDSLIQRALEKYKKEE